MGEQRTFDFFDSPTAERTQLTPLPAKPYKAPRLVRDPHGVFHVLSRRSMPEIIASSAVIPLEVARKAWGLLRDWRAMNADREEAMGTGPWMMQSWDFLAAVVGLQWAEKIARYESRITGSGLLEIYVEAWREAQEVH